MHNILQPPTALFQLKKKNVESVFCFGLYIRQATGATSIKAGGLDVEAGGLKVGSGGATVSSGGLTVDGGLVLRSGTLVIEDGGGGELGDSGSGGFEV